MLKIWVSGDSGTNWHLSSISQEYKNHLKCTYGYFRLVPFVRYSIKAGLYRKPTLFFELERGKTRCQECATVDSVEPPRNSLMKTEQKGSTIVGHINHTNCRT